jgi:hypothetical protein
LHGKRGKDKTMIPGPTVVGDDPWFSDCFMTDQRSFDANVKASSRMHSEIEIDIGGPSENFQFHDCSPTHEIDCEDGGEECTKKGDTSNMKYSNLRGSLLTVIKVDLSAASNNPCYSGSPDIDYVGTVIINPAARVVDFEGKIDAFPAFEMYATANGGAGKLMRSHGTRKDLSRSIRLSAESTLNKLRPDDWNLVGSKLMVVRDDREIL